MIRTKTGLIIVIQFFIFSICHAQHTVTVSGIVKDKKDQTLLPFVNVVLKAEEDGAFVSGTVTGEEGRFLFSGIKPGSYNIEVSYIGYVTKLQSLFVGNLTDYLDLKTIEIEEKSTARGSGSLPGTHGE